MLRRMAVGLAASRGGVRGLHARRLEATTSRLLAGAPDDAGARRVRARLLRSSCAYFAEQVLSGPRAPPYNGRFMVARHHIAWDKLLLDHRRLCLESARDHGKSRFFSFAYPLWQACRHPGGSGYLFSATRDQAERLLADIKSEVEGNPRLQWLYPRESTRRWSGSTVRFSNGHRIYARGYGSRVRGGHPDYVICDDVLNDESAYSEVTRRKQTDYFYSAITNMVSPRGQIIVCGTPFSTQDLYAELSRNSSYCFRVFKAVDDEDRPLWPARYSRRDLADKEREIGSVRFAREFGCAPISDSMSLFPQALFRGQPTEQYAMRLGMPRQVYEDAGITTYMGVDFALSTAVGADYTVLFCLGIDEVGNRWIVDIERFHGMPYHEQLSAIVRMGQRYQPALVHVEANQAQRIFGDELQRKTDLPIRKFVTGTDKHALDKGLPSLRLLLENGKWRIPRGCARSVELTDVWIDEMHNFTYHKGTLQSVGGHDDVAMASWMADQAARKGGFSFSFGDDEGREPQEPRPQDHTLLAGEPHDDSPSDLVAWR